MLELRLMNNFEAFDCEVAQCTVVLMGQVQVQEPHMFERWTTILILLNAPGHIWEVWERPSVPFHERP